jgi:hypothetical protein
MERSAAGARFGCVDEPGDMMMGKGLLLWLVGVPIPVIIVLWLLFR